VAHAVLDIARQPEHGKDASHGTDRSGHSSAVSVPAASATDAPAVSGVAV
jgi:hypothetical protein